jgi:hypothetical protein
MKATVVWALLLAVAPATQERPEPNASIEGSVVDAQSGAPIENARIALYAGEDSIRRWSPISSRLMTPSIGPEPILETRAGAGGRFALRNIEPGAYRLEFQRNGYVRQEYGQRASGVAGVPIRLTSGQSLSGIVARMVPTASVTGRIRDVRERPIAGVPVQLMRLTYLQDGSRELLKAASAWTDDRGEYRLFFITPGRYFVVAGTAPWESDILPDPTTRAVPERFPYTFYPGVGTAALARSIDLGAGANVASIDFILSSVTEQWSVRGRIAGENGRSCSELKCSVFLHYLDPAVGGEQSVNPWIAGEITVKDGAFEITNVAPGAYNIGVQNGKALGKGVPVDVVDSNVSGIVLPMPLPEADPKGVSISGRWRVEGAPSLPDPESLKCSERFGVFSMHLVTAGPVLYWELPRNSGLQPDGRFVIGNVIAPLQYRVAINCLKEGFYLKEARYGGEDVVGRAFHIAATEPRTLDIVFAPNAAAVEGVVTDDRLAPAPGSRAVLVPANRARIDLYRSEIVGRDGRFTFEDLPPGDYKVFAWDGIEDYAYFDADLMRQVEDRGETIHLLEGARQRVTVRSIPGG